MYHLIFTYRQLSSGAAHNSAKSFTTLEETARYLQDEWYDEFCEAFEFPSEWDEEDMGCPFPKKGDFTLEALKSKLNNRNRVVLFDPYSKYAGLVPHELLLTKE